MSTALDLLSLGQDGTEFHFANWPVTEVPRRSPGVYTIWRGPELLYAGMAGRGVTAESHDELLTKPMGLWSRLNSHASGRRSGDQFCVYVCDRFIVPRLSLDEQRSVGEGTLALDRLTRDFVRMELTFRFVTATDGRSALQLEDGIRRGALDGIKPLLNPGR